jgi:hypothetical protein
MIPGFLEHMPEERASRAEKAVRRLMLEGDGAEMDPLEPPVLKFGPQTRLQVGTRADWKN